MVLDFDDSEGSAIFTACDALLGEENDTKHTILSGLLSGEGDLNGVSCKLFWVIRSRDYSTLAPVTRLLSIVQSFLNPPREPTPLPTESEHVETEAAPVDEPVSGIPGSLNVSSSFHFMQASELETPAFQNNAEWVEKPDAEPNGASEEQVQVVEDVSIEPVEVSIHIAWPDTRDQLAIHRRPRLNRSIGQRQMKRVGFLQSRLFKQVLHHPDRRHLSCRQLK